MQKRTVITVSLGLILTGCGGGSGGSSDNGGTPVLNKTITALDGYLYQADVYNGENCTNYLGKTNENGQFTAQSALDIQGPICIKAIPGQTRDMTRGPITKAFNLTANNSSVVSPFTDYIELAVSHGMSRGEALAQLKQHISSLNPSESLLLGDYLKQTDDMGKALLVLGETLVDHQELDIKQKSALIEGMSTLMSDSVLDEAIDFDPTFIPVASIDESGSVTVFPADNYKPVVTGQVEPVTTLLDDFFTPIDLTALFSDKDQASHTLQYQVRIKGEKYTNGLSVNEQGVLEGKPTLTGTFTVFVFAKDNKGATSYPLTFEWQVRDPQRNNAPTVVENKLDAIQSLLDAQQFFSGKAVNFTTDVAGLFEDKDHDSLSYALLPQSLAEGLVVDLNGTTLNISGMTTTLGQQQLLLIANDSVAESAPSELLFNIVEETINPAPSVNERKYNELNLWLTGLRLQANEAVESQFNIESLFVDNDLNTITLAVNEAQGLTVRLEDNLLSINGTPSQAGQFSVTLTAIDKAGSQTPLTISSTMEEAINHLPILNSQPHKEIANEMANWHIEVGQTYSKTIDLTGLFSDSEQDLLTYKAVLNVQGVRVDIDEHQQLHFIGTPSHDNSVGQYSLEISVNDSPLATEKSRWVSTLLPFELHEATQPPLDLSDIGQIDVSPITDGRILYGVVHTTEYEQDEDWGYIYVPPGMTCSSFKFENGKYYYGSALNGSKTCPTDPSQILFSEIGTYEIIDQQLVINYPYNDKEGPEEIFVLRKLDSHDGSVMLTQIQTVNVWGEVVHNTSTHYATAEQANARMDKLPLKSNKIYIADPENEGYVAGMMTVEKEAPGQVSFTLEGKSSYLSCDVMTHYDGFMFIGSTEQARPTKPESQNCQSTSSGIKITIDYQEPANGDQVYFYNYMKQESKSALYLENLGAVVPN
ncbi:hypothetical protein [Photobacterium galatheae]|uniref:Dystroglycan-type cadherin-like domain-containing protein n=1 Tax=Photobacterium galatheae TaxID=1654360 RepID=A0A066RRV7_9GAMM|nr:hypothetical protein [Photobacterium galatheae]KDM93155.1 hypothetical protein EA58_02890 [Photobacterium galatheae]MCM0148317.1 hypothetical protein [Photobacterium galatheae]